MASSRRALTFRELQRHTLAQERELRRLAEDRLKDEQLVRPPNPSCALVPTAVPRRQVADPRAARSTRRRVRLALARQPPSLSFAQAARAALSTKTRYTVDDRETRPARAVGGRRIRTFVSASSIGFGSWCATDRALMSRHVRAAV